MTLGRHGGVSQTDENIQGLTLKGKKDHEVAEHAGSFCNKTVQPLTVWISSLTDGD